MTDHSEQVDIAPLRQPMVTSIGIIMGFLLNFLATWATEDTIGETVMTTQDYAVAITLFVAITLMCSVLFRLLDMRQPATSTGAHYGVTYRLYCTAIVIAFVGIGIALFV